MGTKTTQADDGEGENDGTVFTQQQLDALNGIIGARVQREIKGSMKEQTSSLQKMFGEFTKGVEEKFSAKPSAETPSGVAGDSKGSKEFEEKLAVVKKEQEEFKKKWADAEGRAIAAERQRQVDKTLSDIRAALSGGADPKRKVKTSFLGVLSKDLLSQAKFADDGKVTITIKRSPHRGLPEEEVEVPLHEGLQHWLGTNDAAEWIEAPSSGTKIPSTGQKQPQITRPAQSQNRVALPGDDQVESLESVASRTAAQFADLGIDISKL